MFEKQLAEYKCTRDDVGSTFRLEILLQGAPKLHTPLKFKYHSYACSSNIEMPESAGQCVRLHSHSAVYILKRFSRAAGCRGNSQANKSVRETRSWSKGAQLSPVLDQRPSISLLEARLVEGGGFWTWMAASKIHGFRIRIVQNEDDYAESDGEGRVRKVIHCILSLATIKSHQAVFAVRKAKCQEMKH